MPTVVEANRSGPSLDEASRQYQYIANLAAPKTFANEFDTIDYFPASGGVASKRYFKVGEGNVLLERRGGEGWVDASKAGKNGEPAVTRYYYVDGKLYDGAGKCLGNFAINTTAGAKDLEGRRFLETYGTWQRGDGDYVEYWGKTLSLGNSTALIQLGPPPGLVAVYRSSTKNVLVDNVVHGVRYGFREIEKDPAYEKVWMTSREAARASSKVYTPSEIEKISPDREGWRYADEGRIRFRIVDDGTSRRIFAQRKIHVASAWRDSSTLQTASISWVQNHEVVTVNQPDAGRDDSLPGPGKRGAPAAGGTKRLEGEEAVELEERAKVLLPPVPKAEDREQEKPEVKERPRVVTFVPMLDRVRKAPVQPVVRKDQPAPESTPVAKKSDEQPTAETSGSQPKLSPEPPLPRVTPLVVPPPRQARKEERQEPLLKQLPPPPAVVQQQPLRVRPQDLIDAEAVLRTAEVAIRIGELKTDLETTAGALLPKKQPLQPLPVQGIQPPPLARVDAANGALTALSTSHRFEHQILEPFRQYVTRLTQQNQLGSSAATNGAGLASTAGWQRVAAVLPDFKLNRNQYLVKAHREVSDAETAVRAQYELMTAGVRAPQNAADRIRLVRVIRENMQRWGGPAQVQRWERVLEHIERDLGVEPGAALPAGGGAGFDPTGRPLRGKAGGAAAPFRPNPRTQTDDEV